MASYGHTFTSGDTVTPTKLNAARTVTDIVNADIKNDAAIAHSKLANIPSGQLLLGNGSNVPTATAVTGDVTISNAGVTAITAGSIVTADLADGAVTSAKIADGTIVNADVSASAAIAGTKISPDFGSQNVTTTGAGTFNTVHSTGTTPHLQLSETDASSNNQRWDIVADAEGMFVRAVNDAYTVAGNAIEIQRTGTTIDSVSMPNGNVGIGTASPSYLLDTSSASGPSVRVLSSGADAVMRFECTATGGRTYHVGSTGAASGAGNGFSIYDVTGSSPRMVINASGHVGIAKTNPSTALDVNGTITATAFAGNLTGTASAIADGTVSTAKIVDGNVTDAKIASGVDASKLTTGTLPADRIGSSAITTARINDAAVTPAKLSQPYTLATAQNSTSGTSIDFTGIPSWAKRITVMLNGVSTNGTSHLQVQLGDSGGFETTGYVSVSSGVGVASGFLIASASAANAWHGALIISLLGSNAYTAFGCVANSAAATSNTSAGSKTLSDTLTQIRITTVNGTDAFDAGTINISYEG